MNEDQQSTHVDHSVEADVPLIVPTPPHAAKHPAAKHSKLALLTHPRIAALSLVAVVSLAGIGYFGSQLNTPNAKVETPVAVSKQPTKTEDTTAPAQDAATLSQQDAKAPSGSTPTKTTPKPTTPAPTSAPTPAPTATTAPTPTTNTTNCLSPSSSQYAYYPSMTNSQYLQTNGYANTTKLYAALQFAGLINTINSKQYVVLAMDDSQWSNFTQAQLNWMNASPANMKSVLGWQIVTSCITWNGINPVKDMTNNATRTVTTLNGPVTYTHKTQGPGAFGNGKVGIWDWFTSNGAVTIAGFVNTTSIPL
jgi:hypothetical protein